LNGQTPEVEARPLIEKDRFLQSISSGSLKYGRSGV